jgi:enediyne biosynthesis protein E4
LKRGGIYSACTYLGLCHAAHFMIALLVSAALFLSLESTAATNGVLLHRFEDVAAAAGVSFRNQASKTPEKYLLESMVGGVALFDANGDGRLDIYFVNGAALKAPMRPGQEAVKENASFWNRLYQNNPDGSFTDITGKAGVAGEGYGMGAAVGDFDNDGWQDLYVTNFGRNQLFRNRGGGTFENVTARAGVEASGWSTGAGFIDYDRDGHLDLFVVRYLEWNLARNPWCGGREPGHRAYCHPNHFQPVTHILYRNKRDGTFEDVSRQAGFADAPGKGLGVAFNDFDRDGWPDIMVANDSYPQQLFRNKHDGTFEEVGLFSGLAYDDDGQTFAGMGVDMADYDNDGWPDVFVNALANQRYALFRNQKANFDYVSGPTGVGSISKLHSGWGTRFADLDNDGWKDLFVAQGHVMDNIELTQPSVRYREPLLLMKNAQGKFQDVSAQSGEPFSKPLAARGAAFGDLNNDGALDIVIHCNDEPALLLRNHVADSQSWLILNTTGTKSNRDGIGAAVRIVSQSGREQYGFVSTASSYLSASDKRLHFGLGSDKKVKLVEIHWPSGVVQKLEGLDANQIVTAREPATAPRAAIK